MKGNPRKLTPEAQQLDLLAATQLISDPDVALCWGLIREAIQLNQIGRLNIDRVIAVLSAGDGMGFDEFNIEAEPFGSDHLVVSILDDRRTCSVAKMVAELKRLRARADGLPGGGPSGGSSGSPAASGGGSPPQGGSSSGGDLDLLGLLSGLLGTSAQKLAGDPTAYRAHIERVRSAAAALAAAVQDPKGSDQSRAEAADRLRKLVEESARTGAETSKQRLADLPGTLAALGLDVAHFAGPLRIVVDWLEQRSPDAGAAVDRLIAGLERAATPLLGEARERKEAERDARIRDSARSAIAARLSKLDLTRDEKG